MKLSKKKSNTHNSMSHDLTGQQQHMCCCLTSRIDNMRCLREGQLRVCAPFSLATPPVAHLTPPSPTLSIHKAKGMLLDGTAARCSSCIQGVHPPLPQSRKRESHTPGLTSNSCSSYHMQQWLPKWTTPQALLQSMLTHTGRRRVWSHASGARSRGAAGGCSTKRCA